MNHAHCSQYNSSKIAGTIQRGTFDFMPAAFSSPAGVIFVACGTAYHYHSEFIRPPAILARGNGA